MVQDHSQTASAAVGNARGNGSVHPHELAVPRTLAVAIASVLGAMLPAAAFAGNSTVTASTDHPTGTQIANLGGGNVYDVTTTTVRNNNAFNSFGQFDVDAADTVNLVLPTGTDNLINLVWDSQALINGTVNSYKGNSNQIGGRVFFADPHGVVVGASGVLNVGALAISTPTAAFMGSVLLDGTDAAATQLMRGQAPLADGEVSLLGTINALDDVRVRAHAIDASGLIFVQGGSGANKLDSQVAVNIGAGDGVRLVQDGGNILLVAADAVTVGGALRADGGDVIVQADNTVDLLGSAQLNTRDVAAGANAALDSVNSSAASGNVVIAAAAIDVAQGARVLAFANNGKQAGDITLEARARDKVQTGQAKAESSVTIAGTLRGRDIDATAQSTAESGWDLDINGDALDPVLVAGSQVLGLAAGVSLGYLDAVSSANVSVAGTALMQASRDLTVEAKAIEKVDTTASNLSNGAVANKKAGIAAVYGAIDSDARVDVASGATLSAGESLSLRARTDNTLDITASSITTGSQALVATVAVSNIDVDSTVEVDAGATLSGDAVEISAHNQNTFSTTASAKSNPEGKVGIAGAVSLQDINATATNAADLSGIGSLLLDASTDTDKNLTRAIVAVASQSVTMKMYQAAGDAKAAIADKVVGAFKSAVGIAGSQSSDPKAKDSNSPFRLGSALAFTDASHTATATLADDTSVTATGNVTVHAGVTDGAIRNQANSTVDSDTEQKEQDGSMSKVSLSAGMTYGHYRHDAEARVGAGASIDAARIAVGSETRTPVDISWTNFDSIGNVLGKLDATLGVADEVLSTYTSAKSKAGTAAIGGAVNYHDVGNSSAAWIDDDATLTSRALAAGADAWTSLLASGATANWAQAIDVAAFNEVSAVHMVGPIGLPLPGVSSQAGQDGAAVGGAFNNVIYSSNTIAGIGAGATVTAADGVAVRADSRDTIVVISPMAGTGASIGVTGTVSIADIDDTTHASVSNDASVAANTVDVSALQDYFLWSVSGALTTGNTASVGFAVGINNLSSDTRAFIGDNSADDGNGRSSTDTTGAVATGELDVSASTTGEAGAIAVAGSYTSSPEPGAKPGFMANLKSSVNTKVDGLRGKAADKFSTLPLLDKVADKVRGAQGAGASQQKPPAPKFGLSVSGSASVNMAELGTRAYLDGATVTGRNGGTQSTTVQAVNAAELASASGAAAITRSKAGTSKFNGAMAGAVAYSLIDNDTEAYAKGSTLSNADDVAMRALNAGEQTGIAISVGVEASGGQTTSASFTGSFSIAQSDNNTQATLQDTVITASSATTSGVEVTAYDRARIGVGGGSLYVNTSTGSNANIGAAFTYAETNDDTGATVSGGTISNVDAVAVRAIDSALIGSAAAMGGGGAQANGLAGAGIWNEIGNTAKASVTDGAVIDIDGDIAVSARSSAPVGTLDALVNGGIQDNSGFDFAGTELYANSGEAGLPGTSIVSVAGLVQVGKNNIGLAFVGSSVHNTHEVEIADAQLDAGTGRIDLDASDNTRIISAAVGVGVAKDKFAGMGTATANIIANTDKVSVTGSSLQGAAIDVRARDDSRIDSLAGNVTVSKNTAAGAAVTYNSIGNTVEASSNNSTLDATGLVSFDAHNAATVLAGAVAGAFSQTAAISGSFAWTESNSNVTAALDGGTVLAGDLDIKAENATKLSTLSGSVAVSKNAAIGAAINVVDVSDATTARIDGTGLDIDDDVVVDARGTGEVYSLAVAGAAAQTAAIAGSSSTNLIDNTVSAEAANLHGANAAAAAAAASLAVRATNTMTTQSLAGAVAGAGTAAIGGAIGVNTIGGSTVATLTDSVLAVSDTVEVDAASTATIGTIAVAAGGAQNAAIMGSASTNIITSQVEAGIANTGLEQAASTTTVSARDGSQIDSLAGAAAVAGNVGVGAAVAVNRIGTQVEAYLDGGADNRAYHGNDITVSATGSNPNLDNDANIRTIAIGVGGGADVGGAASVAVNLLDGDVDARIGAGANVLAENNVAVLAQNRQGIDVFAGSVGLGATVAGIGLGVVVNEIGGQTTASIEGASTQVSALAKGVGRNVASGDLLDPDAADVSDLAGVGDYVAPDLSVGTRSVNGVAVNAASQQHVATAGASVGLSFNPLGSFALAAITGTNVLGGSTRASIDGARINQAAGSDGDQQLDVRASSHAMGANFITGASGGASTAAATAAIASNVFAQDTEASIHNATTSARKDVTVDATSSQNSVALSAGVAGAIVGGAASASINVFDARTRAFVTGGTLASTDLDVDASSVNHVNLISGSGAGGGVGIAGSFLVNVGQSETQAYVGDSTADTTLALTGALDIDAASASVIKGVAVSGAVGGAAGVAGMATVNVLANTTQAWLQRAQVSQGAERATTVDVSATELLDLDVYAGALGISGGGYGVGAAANVAVLSSTVSAGVVDSRVDASGAVTVDALSQRDIDAITITAGVGQTAGIGGAASLLLVGLGDRGDSSAELDKGGNGTLSQVDSLAGGQRVDAAIGDGTIDASERDRINQRSAFDLSQALGGGTNGTFASVSNSTVTSGSLAVAADSQLGIRHIAGGLGAGGVGVGGALAYTGVYDTTRATVEDRSQVTVTGGVEVSAHSGDYNGRRSGSAEAYAGAAGLVGVGAAVAIANVDRETTARAGGTLNGGASGTLDINASDTSTVKADAKGAAIGAAAVGIVVAEASKSSTTIAALTSNVLAGGITRNASVSGFNALDIDARSSGAVIGDGLGAAGGLLLAGTGVGVTARDESVVTAETGANATVQVGNGGTSLNAQATPQVSANALGATVGGYVGLGASVALARADANVTATVGAGTVLGGGNLDINATVGTVNASTSSAQAKSIAGTGGFLLGASASVAEAVNHSDATAQTGANVRLPTGTVTVKATNNTSQKAESLGVSAGLLALGASVSKATSDTTTTARLGDGNIGRGEQVGSLYAGMGAVTVHADGTDRNAAYATAGSGGLVAGNAARADTGADATVTAGIGIGSQLIIDKLDLKAEHDTRYAGNADSVNAAALGASGAAIGHQADSTVRARIGNNASVRSNDDIRVQAQNSYHSDNTGASVSAAGGGVFTGAAALVDVDLDGRTFAEIGNGAQLLTAIAPSGTRAGEIHVIANTLATTADSGSLTTGGAINVAVVDINATGNFGNDVIIGDNAWLNSYGYINLGTYTQATLGATALVNTWGLAAVGSADADVSVTSDQNVSVGANATLEAYRNIYLTAGRDARNLQDTRLGANSQAQAYVRGLIAIPDASASGHTASTADVVLATGANALSASNVTAGGYTGDSRLSVDGTGHGYQLGFIPVTQHDSDSGSTAQGTVAIDGTVVAGRYNTLKIDIDGNGNLTQSAGLPVEVAKVSNFMPRQFLDNLAGDCARSDVDGCKALAALRNSVAAGPVGAWYLGSMFAAGGDVFLHGDSITGIGSVTAKGAPSMTVNNLSNHYLVLDAIEVPDYSGGNVRYTGSSNQASGVTVTQEPSTAKPSVQIHNAWQGSNGPAIFAMEDIRNIGGLVRIRNDKGSLGQFGTVYAQQQIVEAPNGIVTFNNLNADWFSGSNPQSDWRSLMLRPGTPDEAVAHIANYVYGTNVLYRAPIYFGDQGSSIVLWGGCLPHNNDQGCGVGPFGTVDFYQKQMPVVPGRALTKTILGYGENPNVAANADSSSFVGQQIYVRANYIDVNSTIDAGAGTNWSLKVNPTLEGWITGLGANATGLHDIPPAHLQTIGAGTRQIAAKYDATNKRIVVDDVNASGGGYVYLDGRIVSSTPHGKIKVSSGYGDVRIDGGVNLPVALQDINVGNGAVGVVEIVDRLKSPSGNAPHTTWYVSRQGQGTQAYDNRNGATNYDAPNAFNLGSATSYNPQAGMRYRWSETARVGRADRYGNWSWIDQWGGGVDPGQQWTTNGAGFYQGTAGGPAFEQNITGSFSNFDDVRIAYHGCDGGLGSDCNYSFKASEFSNHRGDGGHWHSVWTYRSPLRGQINLNGSVKADNAIAIDFSGNAQGIVDVRANGDLFLNGRISNSEGTTTLNASGSGGLAGLGDVIRSGDNAQILTRHLQINSTGGIGRDGVSNALAVTLSDNGSLTANAGARGIWLDIASDAALDLHAQDNSGYGDISVIANGDLSGIAGRSRDIVGRNITLTSRFGAIGNINDPLALEAHETLQVDGGTAHGVVSADALSDIALTDWDGDFWLDRVVSEAGDVRLDAKSGALLDARLRTAADTLTPTQVEEIWDALQLDGSGVADSVEAFENQVTARYREYWRLLGVGTLGSDGVYQVDDASLALFRPLAEAAVGQQGLSDADVRSYVSGRYDAVASYFDANLGTGWAARSEFQNYVAAYTYNVDPASAQYLDLSRNSVWTRDQLKYSINANALEPSSGAVGSADPNVSGRNVTLVATTGIGRLADDLDLDYVDLVGGNLTVAEALALTLANTPGDVLLIAADGHVLSRAELAAFTGADIDNGAIASVRVKRTSPLFVSVSGKLNGVAGANAFLQANNDLRIEHFIAGGDVRLAASGGIANARSDGAAAVVTGGDLVLLAGNGSIGKAASATDAAIPLAVDIAGKLLSASAGQDVLLRQVDGDLLVGSVFANGLIGLEASQGSLLSYLDGITLDGHDLDLRAQGDIGRRKTVTSGIDAPLQVRVAASGQLDGAAGGAIWIASPDRDLNVGELRSNGDLTVTATEGDLTADVLASAAGAVAAAAGGDMHIEQLAAAGIASLTAVGAIQIDALDADSATLNAGTGIGIGRIDTTGDTTVTAGGAVGIDANGRIGAANVAIDGASLAMGAGSRIEADGGIAITTGGDMSLGQLALRQDVATALIALDAGGRIDANGDGQVNLLGGNLTRATLEAGQGIGSATAVLSADIGLLDGHASTGDIHLALPNGGTIGELRADDGSIALDGGPSLEFGVIAAAHALRISGGNLQGDELLTGDELELYATGDVVVATAQAGGDARMHADGGLALASTTVTGDADLEAGDAMTLGIATIGGNLAAQAGTTLAATTLDVDGNVVLDSGTDLQLTSANIGGDLAAQAGNDLAIGTANVAGAASTTSSGASRIDEVVTGSTLDAAAGTDLHIVQATVGSAATLAAGDSLRLDSATIGTDATLDAGTAIQLGTVATGGNIDAESLGTLDAASLAISGDAALESAGAMTLDTAIVDGDLVATSGSSLGAASLAIGGNAALDSADAMTVGTATVGGELAATSSSSLDAASLAIGGNAALDSADAMTVGTATIGGELAANAGTTLAASTLDVDGNVVLDSGTDLQLTSANIGGDLAAQAGNDLAIGTANVAGAASTTSTGASRIDEVVTGSTLDAAAGSDLHIVQATVGSAATLAAGDLLRLDSATIGTDATLDAGTAIQLGTVATGGNIDAESIGTLDAASLAISGNAALESAGAMTLDTAIVDGDLVATSGSSLDAASLAISGNAALDSADAMTLATAIVDGDLVATSGSSLDAVSLMIGGNAALDSADAMTIGTATVGGDLAANAGTTLAATALDVDGDVVLDSGTDLQLTSANIGGDLAAQAGNDLAIGTANVAGAASTTSTGASRIDEVVTGSTLDATAGTDLHIVQATVGSAATLAADGSLRLDIATIGTDATLDAGNAIQLGTVATGGNIDAESIGTLDAASLAISGNAALDSADAMTLATAIVDGDLVATSGSSLDAVSLMIGGNAALDSADAMTIGTATVGGDLAANAGTTLAATALDVDGNVALDSGTDLELTSANIGGDLAAQAGNDLAIGTANVAGAASTTSTGASRIDEVVTGSTLDATAGSDLHIVQATVGSAATLAAGDSLRLDSATIGTDATLDAGTAIQLGTVATGGNIDAESVNDLSFVDLHSGQDIVGTSTAGSILGGAAEAAGQIRFRAAGDIRFDGLHAGGNVDLGAARDIVGSDLHADGDVIWVAGRDIELAQVTAGRAVRLDAIDGLRLGRVDAGTDIALATGRDIAFDTLHAGGGLSIRSRGGDVLGGDIRIGADASLQAARDVVLDEAEVGGALAAQAGRDLRVGRYDVAGDVSLDSGADMTLGSGNSGGHQALLVGGSLAFDALASEQSFRVDATGGRVTGGVLTAPSADIAARDGIVLDLARIGDRLNMASAQIEANVEKTGPGTLSTVLTGYRNGVAQRIVLDVDARDHWLIERLSTLQAQFDTNAHRVDIIDGHVDETMRLTTAETDLWMNNGSAQLLDVDVQMLELDHRFSLWQTGRHTLTDAYVVRFGPGFLIEAPNYFVDHQWTNPDYLGESALRFTSRTLQSERDTDEVDAAGTGADAEREDPIDVAPQGAVKLAVGP